MNGICSGCRIDHQQGPCKWQLVSDFSLINVSISLLPSPLKSNIYIYLEKQILKYNFFSFPLLSPFFMENLCDTCEYFLEEEEVHWLFFTLVISLKNELTPLSLFLSPSPYLPCLPLLPPFLFFPSHTSPIYAKSFHNIFKI